MSVLSPTATLERPQPRTRRRESRSEGVCGLRLDSRSVTRMRGEKTILHGIDFSARPGELVGIFGPSGAGKSTLIRLLTGYEAPTAGQILLGGLSLIDHFGELKKRIGYVPQDDVVHESLCVWECLSYAARLRMTGATPGERESRVQAVLEEVGLTHRVDLPVGSLSGGQRKRVSIAVELLNEPAVLVLDEPTAGLDPSTEERMMSLFRQLADGGRTVLLSTHHVQTIDIVDSVLVLGEGRTLYFGPPSEARTYFGVERYESIFNVLEEASAVEWESRYRAWPGRAERFEILRREGTSPRYDALVTAESREPQLGHLLSRTVRLITADRKNLAILLLQAPVVGAICALAMNADGFFELRGMFFNLVLASIWFGAFNSYREFVKERPIYLRERKVNLRVVPYYASKFLVLGGLCAIQSGLLLLTVDLFDPLGGSKPLLYLALWIISLTGMGMGLAISALVVATDRAVSMVPIALIPQAVLISLEEPFRGVAGVMEKFTVSRWGVDALQVIGEGGGVARCAGQLGVLVAMTAFLAMTTCVWMQLRDELTA